MISAKASFDVTAIIYYYQPTSQDMLAQTGREGTGLVNPNFLTLQRTGQNMEPMSERAIREIWGFVSRAAIKKPGVTTTPADHILPTLIEAAEHGVPSEYDVRLPIPDKFKKDPTYYRAYIEQPNDASFVTVLKGLVPFTGLRDELLRMQERLVVPLHSVRLGFVTSDVAFRASVPARALVGTHTLQ